MGTVGEGGRIENCANRLAGRCQQRRAVQQKSGLRDRDAVEVAKRQIFGHAHTRHSRVLQGLFGQREQSALTNSIARRMKTAAVDKNVSAFDRALSADRLHQFLLPVAGDTRDAQDLSLLTVKLNARTAGRPLSPRTSRSRT